MCGIVGVFDLKGSRLTEESMLRRMNDTQTHRGPDQSGVHIEPGTALGHRRLSIIDLSGGEQPLYNEDNSVVIVYNGEIYNFEVLRKELAAAGHTFRTACDTEVIVHGWEQWGADCVKRFRGMFAFAIWDRNREELFLARDRIGIKPLYYTVTESGLLAFSSEMKALMMHPDVSRNINAQAVEDFLALGYVPDPKSIYSSVSKLEAGHTLSIKRHQSRSEWQKTQYWDLKFHNANRGTEQELADALIENLRDAVKVRMIADVPLGAFLSGGVDSSAVVAMMAQDSEEPINTSSIGFTEQTFDESEYAAAVASRYKTNHQLDIVGADDVDLLDALAWMYDEPFADSSAIPTYRVCEAARKRVTVALSGDGGDEGFAGYRRYRWHMREEAVRNVVPSSIRRSVFGIAGHLYPKIDWAPKVLRAKSTFQALARDSVEAYFHNISLIPDTQRAALYSRQLRKQLSGYRAVEVFNEHLPKAPEHPLSRVQYLDFKTYLPGDILTKVDRASMAHSLEVRVPILDHLFVEWHSGIDPALKLRAQEGKYLLKRALEPHLPNNILYRPKMGFAVPLATWFRGPLRNRVRESLLGERLGDRDFFDMSRIRTLVDDHERKIRDNSAIIWALLMFEAFLRRDEAGPSALPPTAAEAA